MNEVNALMVMLDVTPNEEFVSTILRMERGANPLLNDARLDHFITRQLLLRILDRLGDDKQ